MERKKVAIIGGGPAGSATAIALLNALGEAREFFAISIYHRNILRRWSLGETIPPAANQVLLELGISHLLDSTVHCECPGSLSLWGGDKAVANDFMFDLTGTGFHLNRAYFDKNLLKEVESRGGKIFPNHSLRLVKEKTHGFELGFSSKQSAEKIHADFVVDASGQGASFARRLGIARNMIDEVISIYTHIPLNDSIKLPDYTLLEATQHGWWYISKVPNNQCIVSLTTDKDQIIKNNLTQPAEWLNAYRATTWINDFLPEHALIACQLQKALACSAILSACIGNQWLAVGDAASSYDSITSAGVTQSLIQGKLAGEAMAKYFLQNKNHQQYFNEYQNEVFSQFNQYIGLHRYLYQQQTRFRGTDFWQRRLSVGLG